jgi:hypothetical protein
MYAFGSDNQSSTAYFGFPDAKSQIQNGQSGVHSLFSKFVVGVDLNEQTLLNCNRRSRQLTNRGIGGLTKSREIVSEG